MASKRETSPDEGPGLRRSTESVIWTTLLTSPDQEEVKIDQIITMLQKLLKGLMKPQDVTVMVHAFSEANGLVRLPSP